MTRDELWITWGEHLAVCLQCQVWIQLRDQQQLRTVCQCGHKLWTQAIRFQ